MTRHFINIEGVELECQWIGEADSAATVLVFLHEGLGCIDLWKSFPADLCQACGLAGLVYSRQGYGGSDPIASSRATDFMHQEALDVLPQVLDLNGITQAILVGHSDGASIATIYAGATQDARLQGLILEAPHFFVEPETIQGIEAAKINFESGELRQGLLKYHGENLEGAFWGWNDIWLSPEFLHWNIETFIPQIQVPTLVVQGLDDQYGTQAQIEALQAALQSPLETALLADCGHSPHAEQSTQVLGLMARFIRTRTAA